MWSSDGMNPPRDHKESMNEKSPSGREIRLTSLAACAG